MTPTRYGQKPWARRGTGAPPRRAGAARRPDHPPGPPKTGHLAYATWQIPHFPGRVIFASGALTDGAATEWPRPAIASGALTDNAAAEWPRPGEVGGQGRSPARGRHRVRIPEIIVRRR